MILKWLKDCWLKERKGKNINKNTFLSFISSLPFVEFHERLKEGYLVY